MNTCNKIVNGLWIGSALRPIEQLTIRSFLAHGHVFALWTYQEVQNVPEGTIVKDANEIIQENDVFSYAHVNQFGHGKGSYAGFSDLFRYKLLFDKGGIWVDMDIVCLQPFDIKVDYFFRWHHKTKAVGNILKCPKGSPIMEWCYQQAKEQISSENKDWMLPLRILNDGIVQFELESYIKNVSNADSWPLVTRYLKKKGAQPNQDIIAIHWMNEEWRRLKIPTDKFYDKSLLGRLLAKHNIPFKRLTGLDLFRYKYKLGRVNYTIVNLPFKLKELFN